MKTMINKSEPMFKSEGKEIIKATTNCRTPLAKLTNLSNRAIRNIRSTRKTLGLIFFSVSAKSKTTPTKQGKTLENT